MSELWYTTPTLSDMQLPIFLTGTGHWNDQQPVLRTEGFTEYQITLSVSGEGELRTDGGLYRVRAGDCFFLPPRLVHSYYTVREPWEVYWITFDGHYVETLMRLTGLLKVDVYRLEHVSLILQGMKRLLRLAADKLPGQGDACCKELFSLMLDLRQQLASGSAASNQMSERLQPVLQYIDQHLRRSMTLHELADVIEVTPQHLCLLFRRTFQLRPTAYINKVRINRSKELMLRHRQLRTHELAREVGFDNPGYFNTVFKQHTGMSPGEFRRSRGIL